MRKQTIKLFSVFAGIVVLATVVTACKIGYSFTGAQISPLIKTVFIDYFSNRARVVNPNLSQTFTEKMKDKFG